MLKTFLQFIKESQDIENQAQSQDPKKPTLFIIGDVGYDSPDVQWFFTLDIKDIWKEYESKSIDFNEFVDKYKQKITEKKAEIEKISDTCWYDIKEIMDQSGEYDEENSNKYFRYFAVFNICEGYIQCLWIINCFFAYYIFNISNFK